MVRQTKKERNEEKEEEEIEMMMVMVSEQEEQEEEGKEQQKELSVKASVVPFVSVFRCFSYLIIFSASLCPFFSPTPSFERLS